MKVAQIHNFYQQPGGEDSVFKAENILLCSKKNVVVNFTDHNDRIKEKTKISVFKDTVWSKETEQKFVAFLNNEKPELVHCHNTFPLISPSIYYTCQKYDIPVIQTLHNFRLSCTNALFFRNGQTCEKCLGLAVPFYGVVHGCYRDSRIQSGVVALWSSLHKLIGTWQTKVDMYIALSEFSKEKFLKAGLPPEKIVVKPNFLSKDPGFKETIGDFAMYLGRLSQEKGVDILLKAWNSIDKPLKIVGDGPLAINKKQVNPYVEFTGRVENTTAIEMLKQARYFILPSTCYENFPMSIVEAFACGTPAIVSGHGAMAEIVQDGYTGLHFIPGDADDLAAKIRWANEQPEKMAQMGRNARKEYEAKYTAERNYEMLMGIYERVIERKKLKGKS